MGFKHFAWLAGAMGERCSRGATVHAYGPIYGSGAAVVEFDLDRRKFPTRAEARMAIFEYIEGWYNPHRRAFRPRVPITACLREELPTSRLKSKR